MLNCQFTSKLAQAGDHYFFTVNDVLYCHFELARFIEGKILRENVVQRTVTLAQPSRIQRFVIGLRIWATDLGKTSASKT